MTEEHNGSASGKGSEKGEKRILSPPTDHGKHCSWILKLPLLFLSSRPNQRSDETRSRILEFLWSVTNFCKFPSSVLISSCSRVLSESQECCVCSCYLRMTIINNCVVLFIWYWFLPWLLLSSMVTALLYLLTPCFLAVYRAFHSLPYTVCFTNATIDQYFLSFIPLTRKFWSFLPAFVIFLHYPFMNIF